MSQYNLIRNSYFTSSTSSGTGDVSLSWTQLESLMDGNLTSSGVNVSSSGVLYLDIDLSQRIKIDGVRVYANDLSKLNNVKFFYKNESGDSFTQSATQSGSYYSTTIAAPSAPRYLRITVSGVAITLYECQVLNDDYIVAFGSDGTQYAKYLDQTPLGEEGTPTAVAVYNNNDDAMAADAYVVVDYNGNPEDMYLEISSSQNGTYYAMEDGALLQSNLASEVYTWDMGEFDGTKITGNKLVGEFTFVDLPLVDSSEGFNGGNDVLDYDRVNEKVYAVGLDSGTCKLWEFMYMSNEWDYIGEVYSPGNGSHDDNSIVMSYCDGKVYVMTKLDGSGFASYTLSGTQDNYQLLANPSWSYSLGSNDRIGMCSDGERYVYALTVKREEDTGDRNFKRYDTVSGTWTTLSGTYRQYNHSGDEANRCVNVSMTYDYDRDYVYLISASEESVDSNHYIQRYDVANDTWSNNYLDVSSMISVSSDKVLESISYFNNNIYISCNPAFDSYFVRYNIPTATASTYYLGYYHVDPDRGGPGVNLLAFGGDSNTYSYNGITEVLLFGYIYNNADKMAVYNSTVPNTYTTPIFGLNNKYMSSYFLIDGTSVSGTGSISYDGDTYNGTIRVRSSDTAPLNIEEVYWSIDRGHVINKYNLNTLDVEDPLSDLYSDGLNAYFSLAVDRRRGTLAAVFGDSGYYVTAFIMLVDRITGEELVRESSDDYYDCSFIEFDKDGGVWVSDLDQAIYHFSYNEETSDLELINSLTSLTDALGMAVEMDGNGAWYIEGSTNTVYHLDSNCDTLNSIVVAGDPVAICGTLDNGCWIADNDSQRVYRYGYDTTLIKTVSLSRDVDFMCDDKANGFWYASDNSVYHVDVNGNEDVNVYIGSIYRLHAGYNGCVVSSQVLDKIYYVDKNSNSITHEYTESDDNTGMAVVFSYGYDDYVEFKNANAVYPNSNDPVWGPDGSLEWREVSKDGYFLPKRKYHQAELTVRGYAEVDKVIMAPAVKVEDIQPKSYKNMYVKTNIPEAAEIGDYNTNLRAWWSVQNS